MKTMHQASAFAALGCTLTVALAVPPASHARTVYDAGAALYANCTAASGAYANPYTDEMAEYGHITFQPTTAFQTGMSRS